MSYLFESITIDKPRVFMPLWDISKHQNAYDIQKSMKCPKQIAYYNIYSVDGTNLWLGYVLIFLGKGHHLNRIKSKLNCMGKEIDVLIWIILNENGVRKIYMKTEPRVRKIYFQIWYVLQK